MSGPNNQVAIITGGASGMGEAVAKHLATRGWHVAILDLNEQSGQAVAKETGGMFVKADVTSQKSQTTAFNLVWKTYGQIDFGRIIKHHKGEILLMLTPVFANAGIVEKKTFCAWEDEFPPPELSLLSVEINLNGVIFSTYLGMHYMRRNPHKNGGAIIMTSSSSGIYPAYSLPLYAAGKHGVVGLMRSIAPSLAKEKIRVNCTMPGIVRTNISSEEVYKLFPQDQFTSMDQIVNTVMTLLEDHSLTGKAAEISMDKVYYRDHHDFLDPQMAAIMGAAGEVGQW